MPSPRCSLSSQYRLAGAASSCSYRARTQSNFQSSVCEISFLVLHDVMIDDLNNLSSTNRYPLWVNLIWLIVIDSIHLNNWLNGDADSPYLVKGLKTVFIRAKLAFLMQWWLKSKIQSDEKQYILRFQQWISPSHHHHVNATRRGDAFSAIPFFELYAFDDLSVEFSHVKKRKTSMLYVVSEPPAQVFSGEHQEHQQLTILGFVKSQFHVCR